MTSWYANPVFNSTTLVVALGAALLAAVMFLSPELRRMTPPRRRTLLALRIAIFLLVIAALLRPTYIFTEMKRLPATVVVLVDRSRSMQVEDESGGTSRWNALRATLKDSVPELRDLADNYEIKVYEFDADVAAVELDDGQPTLSEKAEGQQSAIGAALEDVLRREAGKRLAAVILASDGAQQAYAPRDIPPQTATRRLADLGTPLYTVAFGRERSASQSRDVAVTELLVNPTVYVKNELALAATLRVDGLANQNIPVQVLFETTPGKMEVIATLRPRANENAQFVPINAAFIPDMPGERKLTLRAVPPEGVSELVTTNNELSTFVTVLDGGLRVLYLEGRPREEMAFIRRSLEASPDIQVDFHFIDQRGAKNWPVRLGEGLDDAFQPGAYDVYMIGDLDSTVFEAEVWKSLVQAVERGAGLIMLGGYHSFWPGGYNNSALRQILPLEVDDQAGASRQRFEDGPRKDMHLPGPVQMLPDKRFDDVPFMQLAPRAENAAAWQKLPPLKGANLFRELKKAARPLAVTDKGAVLMAALEPGGGRVLAFAGDSTYQWRLHGFDAIHKRFWRQVILWLAHVDEAGPGDVTVRLGQRRFNPGQRVEFTASVKSLEPEIVANARLEAEVILPNGTRQAVRLSRQGEEATGAILDTQEPGDYKIVVSGSHEGTDLGKAEGRFTVHFQDLELDNASARPMMLAQLSQMTAPRGRAVPPESLPELLRELQEAPPEMIVQSQDKYTPWDRPEFFILLVGLLCAEWYLRKRWGLV
ncbi:MAG: hypothetical protein WD894_19160 [Pirellulales bacterium]